MAEVVSLSEGRAARSRYRHGRLMRKHMQVVMAVHGCIPDPNPLPLPPALVAPPTADVTLIRVMVTAPEEQTKLGRFVASVIRTDWDIPHVRLHWGERLAVEIRAQATEDYAPQHAAYELARRVVIPFQQVAISVRVFATERQEAG